MENIASSQNPLEGTSGLTLGGRPVAAVGGEEVTSMKPVDGQGSDDLPVDDGTPGLFDGTELPSTMSEAEPVNDGHEELPIDHADLVGRQGEDEGQVTPDVLISPDDDIPLREFYRKY